MFKRLSIYFFIGFFFTQYLAFAQSDAWLKINGGIGKCATIGNSGGVASLEADNFKIEKFLHMRGEVYAYISYATWQVNVSDPGGCSYGIFRYDKTSQKWIRITNGVPGGGFSQPIFVSNAQDIFAYYNGMVYKMSTDYAANPSGWTQISKDILTNTYLMTLGGPTFSPGTCECFSGQGRCDITVSLGDIPGSCDAIGDTIFAFADGGSGDYARQNPAKCGIGLRYVAKFAIKTGKWSVDYIGKFPHELFPNEGMSDRGPNKVVITDFIAGMFRYFISYNDGGTGYCVPKIAWVFDPRDKTWKNISKGVDYTNMTGNSCKDVVCKSFCSNASNENNLMPAGNVEWAGAQITSSWDKSRIYLSSQTGIYQWEGSRWIYIAKYWGGGAIYPTSEGFYVISNQDSPTGIDVLRNANYIPVGNRLPWCLRVGMRDYISPDDGKSFFIFREAENYNGDCAFPDWSVYTTSFNPDRPATVRNLHIQTGTYLGSNQGTNEPVDVGVGAKKNLFIAGNYSSITGTKSSNFKTINIAGATNSSPGKIIRMNKFGDTTYSVSNIGTKRIIDFNLQNYGKNLMVVATEEELYLLDSSANFIWKKPLSDFGNSLAPTTAERTFNSNGQALAITDIDDLGNVVVLRGYRFYVVSVNGVIKNPGGTSINAVPTDNDKYLARADYINDIAIKNDTVFVTGLNNGCLTKLGSSGCSGAEVQSAFVRAFSNSGGGNYQFIWRMYDITGPNLTNDIADTRGYLLNVGRDGKLYFGGESAGPAGVFRWNGKTCQKWGNARDITVGSDPIWKPTESPHVAFFCTVDPKTGIVERGQFIAPENSNGKLNTFRLNSGSIYADEKGFVYVGGVCAYRSRGREIQHVNGQLVGDYIGDLSIVIVDPGYERRTFWGTFAEKRKGSGTVAGFGINGNVICVLAKVTEGYMVTGGSKYNSVTEAVEFKKTFVPLNEPFYPAKADGLDDSYLAVWYQDVWMHSQDSLEERRNPGNVVIPPDQIYWKANFDANGVVAPAVVQACVGESITFTDKTLGAKDSYSWDFGVGAVSATGANSSGPHSVSYSSPGEKSPKLSVRLKNDVVSTTVRPFYINVLANNVTLPVITGPSSLCAGSIAEFQVGDFANLGVYGITNYVWEFPAGATVIANNGYKVKVQLGANGGNVCVSGKYACGITPKVCFALNILQAKTNQVVLVTDKDILTAGETSIKTRLESNGYSVISIPDSVINAGHAGCASLIFVSPSAEASKVATKLLDVAVPVVVSNPDLFDDFAFTNTSASQNGSTQATNLSIGTASELSGTLSGSVQVYPNSQTINFGIVVGNPIIAATDAAGNAAIFGYDKGSLLKGVNTAKARRVGFFGGVNGLSGLSNNGLILFDRTICWSMGNCPSNSKIELVNPMPTSLCPGQTFKLKFKTTGVFDIKNVFSVQLSNLQGQFIQVQTLVDTLSSAIGEIEVEAKMPTSIVSGNAYKLRISSSTPSVISLASADITVLALPASPVEILGALTACANSTISEYNIVAIPNAISYKWDVPIGANFVNTTQSTLTTSAIKVSVDFSTSTSNEIKVYAINGCGINPIPARKLITITGQMGEPQASPKTITENKAICAGSVATYVASLAPSATSYVWTVPSGVSIVSGQGTNTFSVDFGTVKSGNISVKAIGACGESAAKEMAFLVAALPSGGVPGSISGPTEVCIPLVPPISKDISDLIVTGSASSSGNISFVRDGNVNTSWETNTQISGNPPAGWLKIDLNKSYSVTNLEIDWESGSNSFVIETSVDGATYTSLGTFAKPANNFKGVYTINKSVRFLSVKFPVNSRYYVSEIRVKGAELQELGNYSIAPVNGATSYQWTLPGGSVTIGTTTSNSISADLIKAFLPGEVSVKAVLACGLSKASSVSVSRCGQFVPSFEVLKKDSLCANKAVSVKNTTKGVADTYNWDFGNDATPKTFVGATPPTVVYSTIGSKTLTLETIKAGVKVIFTQTLELDTLPNAPVFNTFSSPLCAVKNTFFVQNQAKAKAYQWVVPSGMTGNSQTESIDLTTSVPQTYALKVSAMNKCGLGKQASQSITITDCSPIVVSVQIAKKIICLNEKLVINNNTTGSQNFTWNFGVDGTSSNTATAPIQNVTYTSPGKKMIFLEIEKGTSKQVIIKDSITVLALPTKPDSILGAKTICPNQTDITYSVKNSAGKYSWVLPNTWVIKSSNADSSSLVLNAGNLGGTLFVKSKTVCGVSETMNFVVNLNSNPSKPDSILGANPICPNQTDITYSIKNASGKYAWILPNTWVIKSSNADSTSLILNAGNLGGTLLVKSKTACGVSEAMNLEVRFNSNPTKPDSILGAKTICPNQTDITYSIKNAARKYTWTVPNTWTIQSSNADSSSLILNAGTIGGTLSVKSKTICGVSEAMNLEVRLNSNPTKPDSILGAKTICPNQTDITYSIKNAARKYTWTVPNTWTIQSSNADSSSLILNAGNLGGTLSVKAKTVCGISEAMNLAVTLNSNPAKPDSILGAKTICPNQTAVSYSIKNAAGKYSWVLPNTWVIKSSNADSSTLIVNAGTVGGTLSVKAKTVCGISEAMNLDVTLNSNPVKPDSILGAKTICPNQTAVSYSIKNAAGKYSWVLPNTWVIKSSNADSSSLILIAGNVGGTLSVKAKTVCGISEAMSLAVNTISQPVTPVLLGKTELCLGDTGSFSINKWKDFIPNWFINGQLQASKDSILIFTVRENLVKIEVSLKDKNCSLLGEMATVNVLVNSVPSDSLLAIIGSIEVCEGEYDYSTFYKKTKQIALDWTCPKEAEIMQGQNANTIKIRFNETPADSSFIGLYLRNQCGVGTSVKLKVLRDRTCDFWIANSFTLGSSNEFDTWPITGLDNFPKTSILVYNRWGSKVFESIGYKKPWDGSHNGNLLPTGVYYYVIDRNKEGEKPLTGSVTIVR